MTENEAIEILQTEKACVTRAMNNECNRDCYNCDLCEDGKDIIAGYEAIIKAIEENQRFHAIGTIEEFQKLKALFGNENLEISETATKILKEYPEYLCIGTIEEFKDLKEKSVAKKPSLEGDGYYNGQLVYDTWICPCCDKRYEVDYEEYEHCPSCGQKIDWGDEE